MDFTTKNMSLKERYDILNKVDLIPIGTICYEAGDFTEWTKEIVVNEENQKRKHCGNCHYLYRIDDSRKTDRTEFMNGGVRRNTDYPL